MGNRIQATRFGSVLLSFPSASHTEKLRYTLRAAGNKYYMACLRTVQFLAKTVQINSDSLTLQKHKRKKAVLLNGQAKYVEFNPIPTINFLLCSHNLSFFNLLRKEITCGESDTAVTTMTIGCRWLASYHQCCAHLTS
jgi:hypothetical protein